ncbi:MAG: TetR/AcrR family transcriptional regulator [Acidimicrobiales bacterium]
MSDWPLTVAERSSRSHGRRTLCKLLDAAVAELDIHGYHGARMARIAKSAGVAHGTVYVYFKDKDDLLAALQQDVDAELSAALLAMPEILPGGSGADDLSNWVAEVGEVFQRRGPVLQALADAIGADEQSTAGRAALRSMRKTSDHMARRFRDAGTAGTDMDPEIAGICLFALLEGANRALYLGELPTTASELAHEIAGTVQRATYGSRPSPRARGLSGDSLA